MLQKLKPLFSSFSPACPLLVTLMSIYDFIEEIVSFVGIGI
jgi:hypothetical protein